MTTKLDGIEKDVRALKTQLEAHIGDIGLDAHGVAGQGLPGFMPAQFYQPVYDMAVSRQGLNGVTDVNELEPGFYYGSGMTANTPPGADASAGAAIDVSAYGGADSGQKLIRYTVTSRNTTWEKVIHAPGGSNKDWMQVKKMTKIWSGALTDVNSEQTFSESATRFSRLLVDFGTTIGTTGSVEFDRAKAGSGVFIDTPSMVGATDNAFRLCEAKFVTPTADTFRLSANKSSIYAITSGTISYNPSDVIIVINNVWGVN